MSLTEAVKVDVKGAKPLTPALKPRKPTDAPTDLKIAGKPTAKKKEGGAGGVDALPNL